MGTYYTVPVVISKYNRRNTMVPKYTGEWNRGLIYRGNTFDGFSIRIKNKLTNEPIIPASVRAQITNERGRHVYTLEHTISSTGRVTLGEVVGEITETWVPGPYTFGVEYTSASGRVRTYVMGYFQIIEDNQR